MSSLDFLVIGAQKAGTTSLAKYLSAHPEIFVPPAKELPFFNRSEFDPVCWPEYLTAHFSAADPLSKKGTCTPHYMCDVGSAENIRSLLPDVKLIACLRDPIDRAISHHAMNRRRGTEDRNFAQAISMQMEEGAVERARHMDVSPESVLHTYLAWSEYGRVLCEYQRLFGRSQILIVYFDDLSNRPEQVYGQILEFLGVDSEFRPENLGVKYHAGGTQQRFRLIKWLLRSRWVHGLGNLLPRRFRGRILFNIEVWNTRRGYELPQLSDDQQRALRDFFQPDIRIMEDAFDIRLPWRKRYLSTDSQPAP